MKTNNVTRFLESRKVPFTAFDLPEEKLGAQETSRILGVPVAFVYKTIVVTREGRGKPVLAVVPGDREVDLRLLAQALGEKKVHLPTQREAEALTGLKAGGISPLALINRGFQVLIDAPAQSLPEFYISGGQWGLNIRLAPSDLAKLVNARFAAISKEIPSTL